MNQEGIQPNPPEVDRREPSHETTVSPEAKVESNASHPEVAQVGELAVEASAAGSAPALDLRAIPDPTDMANVGRETNSHVTQVRPRRISNPTDLVVHVGGQLKTDLEEFIPDSDQRAA